MKDLFKGCWTIPNLLSFLRIVLVPFFAYFFLEGKILLAVLMLALSGLSDFLDGKIARRFNQISALGKVLDPVADKLTQITIAVLLFITFHNAQDATLKVFSWVFLVFILKEAIMVVGGLIMLLFNIRPVAAEFYGKLATAAFYGIMLIVVAFGPEIGVFRESLFQLPNTVMMVLVAISAVRRIGAFLSYMPETVGPVKEYKQN